MDMDTKIRIAGIVVLFLFALLIFWAVEDTIRRIENGFGRAKKFNKNIFGKIEIDKILCSEGRELFRRFCNVESYENSELDEIIKLAGYHESIIEILAKTQEPSRPHITSLLDTMKKTGFDLSAGKNMEGIEKEKFFAGQVYKLLDLTQVTPEELGVLKIFPLQSSGAIPPEYAEALFEDKNLRVINGLVKKGWVKKLNGGYLMPSDLLLAIQIKKRLRYEELDGLRNYTQNQKAADELYKKLWMYCYVHVEDTEAREFLKDALSFLEECLEVRKKLLGESSPDTLIISSNIVAAYGLMGEYEKALELSDEAMNIIKKDLVEDKSVIAVSYIALGKVYCRMKEYERAFEFCFKAVDMLEKEFGTGHLDTAGAYADLSELYADTGNREKAIEFNTKALEIYEREFGPVHMYTRALYNNLNKKLLGKGLH